MPRKKSHATLTNPDELLDSPIGPLRRVKQRVDEEAELDEGPEPNEPSDSPPEEEEPRGAATTQPPEEAQNQTPPVPIALALPEQTRRVRELVLPAWYAHRYNPASPLANDPAVADYIMTVNATLSMADHAMMTQDVGLMILAYRTLERMQT